MHFISDIHIFNSYFSNIKLFYIIKEIFIYIFNIDFVILSTISIQFDTILF